MKKFDVLVIGAGPAGIFTALELNKQNPNCKILIIDKGRNIEKRVCPERTQELLVSVPFVVLPRLEWGGCLFRWKIKSFPK